MGCDWDLKSLAGACERGLPDIPPKFCFSDNGLHTVPLLSDSVYYRVLARFTLRETRYHLVSRRHRS